MTIHPCDADRQRTFAIRLLRFLATEANSALDRRRRSIDHARLIAEAYGVPGLEIDAGSGRVIIPDIDKALDM